MTGTFAYRAFSLVREVICHLNAFESLIATSLPSSCPVDDHMNDDDPTKGTDSACLIDDLPLDINKVLPAEYTPLIDQ